MFFKAFDYKSINSGKSIITSRLVNTSFLSLGVQNTSTTLTQYPSSTSASAAMLDKTSFVPARLNPAPSNLLKVAIKIRIYYK